MSQLYIQEQKKLPESWQWTNLENFTDLVFGQSPSSSSYNKKGNGLPFFQGRADFNELYPSISIWCTGPKRIAEKDDVLICVRAGVGATNLNPEKSCIGRGIAAIQPLCGVNPLYILFYLRSIEYLLSFRGSGSTITGIKTDELKDLQIAVAPLLEQQRIVLKIGELFSKLDETKLALNKVKIQLLQYRRLLQKNAFEGSLTESWRRDNPIAKPDNSIIKSWEIKRLQIFSEDIKNLKKSVKPKSAKITLKSLEGFPKSWIGMTVESTCIQIIDCPHSTPKFIDEGEYCIDTTCIEQSKIHWNRARKVSSDQFVERTKRGIPKQEDVLFSREGTIGTSVKINSKNKFCLGQRVMLFRFAPFIIPDFAELFLQSPIFINQYIPLIKSTTSPHLNITDIRQLLFPIPPLKEQQSILEILKKKLTLIDNNAHLMENLSLQCNLMKKSILKSAFEGKLVPQNNNDEPAIILFEKIKKIKKQKS